MSFLEKILPGKRAEARRLADRFAARPPRRPRDMPVRDFAAAVCRLGSVIAEVKHRSPSHPHFRQTAAPARLAAAYQRGGAAALSLVTDREHFGTSLDDVPALRAAAGLPVLVKDFVVDRSQITAAWAAGADAVLLIARMLDRPQLGDLLDHVHRFGLQALVECHDEQDIADAVAVGARILGINNRNLATLQTDLEQTPRLIKAVPPGIIKISESGIETREQIRRLTAAGAQAFLIGHALLLSPDPGGKVRELAGLEDEQAVRVKVCGLTTAEDAATCHQLGADILGVIFAPSPRRIDAAAARDIRRAVPAARLCGVFRDAPAAQVIATAAACDLDLIQLHGNEAPDYCAQLRQATGLPLIKVVGPDEMGESLAGRYPDVAYFMVDLPKDSATDLPAGRQEGRDRLARQAARLRETGCRVFLAGGLDPDNVKDALTARPFAVDVCSGVEIEPGRKNPARMAAFLQEVR